MSRSGKLAAGAIAIVIAFVLVFIIVKVFTGTYEEGVKLLTSVISLALAGLGAFVFGPPIKAWFSRDTRPAPGPIKILVYGHSGSGKSTFIENALAYEQARPSETFGFATYSARINMSLRPVPAAKGPDDADPNKVSSYQAEDIEVLVADYRGQDPRQVVTRPDPEFFGPPERRAVNAILFVVDYFPAYKHADSGQMYHDEEVIAEVTRDGADRTWKLIRERATAHSIYLSKINIGFVFDVVFSPGQDNLRCVKLLINKADLLTSIVRAGQLPGVDQKTYRQFEAALFGEIRRNIETTCRQNGIPKFSVIRLSSTDLAATHGALREILAECHGRGK